jgi:hypothetical protein
MGRSPVQHSFQNMACQTFLNSHMIVAADQTYHEVPASLIADMTRKDHRRWVSRLEKKVIIKSDL